MPRPRKFRLLHLAPYCLAALCMFAFSSAAQESGSASLVGTVRDSQGKPVADAVVELGLNGSSQKQTTHASPQGTYALGGLREGVYSLRVRKPGYAESGINSVFLRAKEEKKVDVVLGAASAESALGKPEFSDEPQFTVSGVTDVTNLGGHGSDTVVRTREALAEGTVSLANPAPGDVPARSSGDKKPLQASAQHIRTELAQHDQAELHRQLGEIEEKLGDPLEAVRQYQRAAEMDPSETNFFVWGSEVLLHHAPKPAMEIFTKGNARFPGSERMLLGLGAASFAVGANEEAIQQISRASDLNPSDPIPYIFLGKIELAENRPSDHALEKLQRFVTLQPGNAEANYYYAVALWKKNQAAQDSGAAAHVESLLNNALRLDSKFAAAYLQLGIVQSDQGKYAEAVSNYTQAIRLGPKMEEPHYRLAQAYRQLGQTERAKEELRLYERLAKESTQQTERSRQQIRQLVYTLRTADR